MTLNILSAKRVSCFGQYDRIDNLIPLNLCSDKCPIIGQFLVYEFHFSTVFNRFDPFILWHVHSWLQAWFQTTLSHRVAHGLRYLRPLKFLAVTVTST